jgi:hypothetical protein
MTLSFKWIQPNGGTWALSGIQDTGDVSGFGVLDAVRGLDLPPYELVTDAIPLQPGQRLRAVKTNPRTVDLPIHIRATSTTLLQSMIRSLRWAFEPTAGDGTLQITAPDGVARNLNCRYQGGWLGDLSSDHYGVTWQDILVTLYACDPYFYAIGPIVTNFAIGSLVTTFLTTPAGNTADKFLPLQLTGSTVLGIVPITNLGDVLAWPVWTVTGPATNVILTNFLPDGTSRTLEVDPSTPLTTGQIMVIDTRPGHKTVIGPGGVNMFGDMNATSVIWSLQPGTNTVRVSVTGATVATQVRLEYTPAYLGL